MSNWSQFGRSNPNLAAFGRERLSSRAAYLAAIRADGSPRVHPITPIVGSGHLYVCMSTWTRLHLKGAVFQRDPRCALPCSVENWNGGAFVIHGTAARIIDPQTRAEYDSYAIYKPKERCILFELFLL